MFVYLFFQQSIDSWLDCWFCDERFFICGRYYQVLSFKIQPALLKVVVPWPGARSASATPFSHKSIFEMCWSFLWVKISPFFCIVNPPSCPFLKGYYKISWWEAPSIWAGTVPGLNFRECEVTPSGLLKFLIMWCCFNTEYSKLEVCRAWNILFRGKKKRKTISGNSFVSFMFFLCQFLTTLKCRLLELYHSLSSRKALINT